MNFGGRRSITHSKSAGWWSFRRCSFEPLFLGSSHVTFLPFPQSGIVYSLNHVCLNFFSPHPWFILWLGIEFWVETFFSLKILMALLHYRLDSTLLIWIVTSFLPDLFECVSCFSLSPSLLPSLPPSVHPTEPQTPTPETLTNSCSWNSVFHRPFFSFLMLGNSPECWKFKFFYFLDIFIYCFVDNFLFVIFLVPFLVFLLDVGSPIAMLQFSHLSLYCPFLSYFSS